MIVTICESCQPEAVEEKTKYYGVGVCQSCGAEGKELHGHSLLEILKALKRTAAEHRSWTLRGVSRQLRQQAEGCANSGLAVACGELMTTADRLLREALQP
jgi:hypothetical protein